MSKDNRQASNELVSLVADALRSYTSPYHSTYPLLLSQGFNKKSIRLLLSTEEEIVDYHVDRFFSKVPGLHEHPQMKEIIAEGIMIWERSGSPLAEPPLIVGHRLSFHTSGPPAKKAAPRLELVDAEPKPEPEPISKKKSTLATSTFVAPSEDLLVHRINALAPSQRKLLNVIMSYPEMPATSKLTEECGMSYLSLKAKVSSTFSSLGLTRPVGTDSTYWRNERFLLLKEVYLSGRLMAAHDGRKKYD